MPYTNLKKILVSILSQLPEVINRADRITQIVNNIEQVNSKYRIEIRNVLNKLLISMIEREASDIEIGGFGTDNHIWLRVFGQKERVKEFPQLTSDEATILICNLLNNDQLKNLVDNKNLDFSYSFYYERKKREVRFRACTYYDIDTLAMNIRAINTVTRPIESFCFHPDAFKVMNHKHQKFGLTLITGITGSGKSTTLDSIIDYHNNNFPVHIVIIASPIEYVHISNMAIIRHREVGRDVLSFKDGVIESMRQDPDIIVIGEMRDPETIMAALEVTDTGHKVFSTLHTSSAVESIDRIVAEVHPNEQERVRNRLADVLVAVVSQKLVPSIDGKLVLAKEVLVVNSNVRAAIKNNNTSEIYMMINQSASSGMITMEQDLKRLYLNKTISLENAMAYANHKKRMQQILA